jgi:DNA-binding IscR family transcriptional regulator
MLVVCFNGELLTTSEMVATSVGTSGPVVRRLLVALAEAGLLQATLGRSGGYILAKDSRKISLKDVWLAVETDELFPTPARAPSSDCPVGAHIHQVLEAPLAQARKNLEQQLARTSLWDLAQALPTH